jgi:hypothetical protein
LPLCADIVIIPERLIVPGGTLRVESECVITYGLDSRSTVTMTGWDESRSLLCVRREILSVSGEVIEPCELPVRTGGDTIEETIAIAVSALVLGWTELRI